MDNDELNMNILIDLIVILFIAIMISIIIFLVKDEIDFHNSHYTQESEIIVTADKKETESRIASVKPFIVTHDYYIILDGHKIEISSSVYDSLREGDKIILHKIEWINKDTGKVDKTKYELK